MKRNLIVFMLMTMICSIAAAGSLYRLAGGNVFSIYDSAWVNFGSLEVGSVGHGLIVCTPFYLKDDVSVAISQGAYVGHSYSATSTHRVYGDAIVLVDYPGAISLTPGCVIGPVKAVLVDSATLTHGPSSMTTFRGTSGSDTVSHFDDLQNHSVYDMGVDYYPPTVPLTAAEQASLEKKKQRQSIHTFHWLQKQATNGSLSAQCSLGQHYLNGDGTVTNLIFGNYWLKKAADGGDIEASNTLVKLSQTNSIPVADDQN